MKAVKCLKYGPPQVLQVEEVEKPIPKDNEILIKIHAAVVSPSDCAFRKGEPFISRLFSGLKKPKFIPGDIFAGEIEAIGKDVKKFQVGDQVLGTTGTSFGAHAEYKCISENETLNLKPVNMTYEEAVTICDGGLTALPFLRDLGEIQSGQQILINGASGAVGTYAIQLAKYFGAIVTGVCSTVNQDMIKKLGADNVIDYTKEDFIKSDQDYDIIFDTIGKSNFSQCKGILKPNGIYMTTIPTVSVMLQMLLFSKFSKNKAKFAATGLKKVEEKIKDLKFLIELFEQSKLKPIIDRTYSLNQIVEAQEYVEKGHKKGNVVLVI